MCTRAVTVEQTNADSRCFLFTGVVWLLCVRVVVLGKEIRQEKKGPSGFRHSIRLPFVTSQRPGYEKLVCFCTSFERVEVVDKVKDGILSDLSPLKSQRFTLLL